LKFETAGRHGILGGQRTAEGGKRGMSEQNSKKILVCPLWKVGDHRFHARHYGVRTRMCTRCGEKVIVAESLKQIADSDEVLLFCENCDLVENSK
jgi:ribosomal protein L34